MEENMHDPDRQRCVNREISELQAKLRKKGIDQGNRDVNMKGEPSDQ